MCLVEPVGRRERGSRGCCVWCCRRLVCCRSSRVYCESWEQPALICGHMGMACIWSVDVVRRRERLIMARLEKSDGLVVLLKPLVFVYRPLSRRARLRVAVNGKLER
jgi:hypothetical protein